MAENKDKKEQQTGEPDQLVQQQAPVGEIINGSTILTDRTHEGVEVVLESAYLSPLVAVAADFLIHEKGQKHLKAAELKKLIQANLDTGELTGEALDNFQTRIELFKLLRGQTGREIRRELRGFEQSKDHASPGMIAPFYLQERDNFGQFIDGLLAQTTSPSALNLIPLNENLKRLTKNPEALYERILMEHTTVAIEAKAKDHLPKFVRENDSLGYAENYQNPLAITSARKTKIPKSGPISAPVDKWIPLVTQTFRHAPADLSRALLDSLGHIPEDLYTKKVFQSLSFGELAKFHNTLRDLQSPKEALCGRGEEYHLQRVLHARTQLLTHLFLSGVAESVKKDGAEQVTIDVNGIWINIVDDKRNELHAHVPFAYVTDELCDYLEENNWITKGDALEIRLQRAKNNNDLLEEERLESQKARSFAEMCDIGRQRSSYTFEHFMETVPFEEARKTECPSIDCAEIAALIQPSVSFIPQSILNHGLKLPESAVKYFLNHFYEEHYAGRTKELENYKRSKIVNALQIAETIQSSIADEVNLAQQEWRMTMTPQPKQEHEKMSHRQTHDLASTARKTYKVRQRILNDTNAYDAAKILGVVLEEANLEHSVDDRFMVFRGNYGEKDGHVHQFLEVVHGNKIVRVLVDPNKQLTKRQRDIFNTIPELSRDQYEILESFNVSFSHLSKKIYFLTIDIASQNIRPESIPEIDENMKEINSIIITEFPGQYNEVLTIYRHFQQAVSAGFNPINELRAYVSVVKQLENQFAQKIFGPANPARAVLDLSVELKRDEVIFDENFYGNMPEKDEKPWVCDKDLSTSGRTIKVVYAEGDRSIPYAMEAKAIRALGLMKDRPVINIAGGCRDTNYDPNTESPSIKMGRKIMKVAHQYKANVAPPGTQSGFGADMSKVWLDYQDNFDHLDAQNKAHCFAVSPGGETWYPGNPRLSTDQEREAYAIAPMDSILTPFDAGWNWTGERKSQAPYFHHVEYMEAIYQRLSEGQKRVQVIGNGGLFTIVEANAALRNNVPVILTEDTGRFADLAINIFKNFNQWELLNNVEANSAELDRIILEIINNNVPEEYRKALLKDFGQELYRKHLYEFLLLSRGGKIIFSSIDNLDDTIAKVLQ